MKANTPLKQGAPAFPVSQHGAHQAPSASCCQQELCRPAVTDKAAPCAAPRVMGEVAVALENPLGIVMPLEGLLVHHF